MAGKLTISVFLDEFHRPLAALDRCTLNRGAFAFKIVQGDSEMATQARVTLNRGGRNSRFDCRISYNFQGLPVYEINYMLFLIFSFSNARQYRSYL